MKYNKNEIQERKEFRVPMNHPSSKMPKKRRKEKERKPNMKGCQGS